MYPISTSPPQLRYARAVATLPQRRRQPCAREQRSLPWRAHRGVSTQCRSRAPPRRAHNGISNPARERHCPSSACPCGNALLHNSNRHQPKHRPRLIANGKFNRRAKSTLAQSWWFFGPGVEAAGWDASDQHTPHANASTDLDAVHADGRIKIRWNWWRGLLGQCRHSFHLILIAGRWAAAAESEVGGAPSFGTACRAERRYVSASKEVRRLHWIQASAVAAAASVILRPQGHSSHLAVFTQ